MMAIEPGDWLFHDEELGKLRKVVLSANAQLPSEVLAYLKALEKRLIDQQTIERRKWIDESWDQLR